MRYAEMRSLPKKAGIAVLEFGEPKDVREPTRDKNRIVLARQPDDEFFPLQEGRQFLLRTNVSRGLAVRYEFHAFFGGTDEQPFLVRLNGRPLSAFSEGGESAFYDALKPEIIKQLERLRKIPARRQGDFFAMPLGCSWDNIAWLQQLFSGDIITPTEVKELPVNETRHRFTGTFCKNVHVRETHGLIVEGTLQAPDHAEMKLAGDVYFLIQAQNLADPQHAD